MPAFENTFLRSVYFPSMTVNLKLRFDEGATPLSPQSPDGIAAAPGSASMAPPSNDNLSYLVGLVPKNASVELPGYRQAGTFRFTLEYRDLPLDPRVIRAIGVSIHLDAVSDSDWATGMLPGNLAILQEETGSEARASILTPTDDNLVIAGIADGISVEHTSSGSTVLIEGRDLRGVFLDTPFPAAAWSQLDLSQPLSSVVNQILSFHPFYNAFHVEPGTPGIPIKFDVGEWGSFQLPSPWLAGNVSSVNMPANGSGRAVNPTGAAADTISFWDVITRYCFFVGAIPYFIGSVLWLRRARSLFDVNLQNTQYISNDPTLKTPFANGAPRSLDETIVSPPQQLQYRRLVFGKDIDNLHLERKLGGAKVPVVKVISVNPDQKGSAQLVTAQVPSDQEIAALASSVSPDGSAAASDPVLVKVSGIINQQQLLDIARDIREEIGRQEIGGNVQTKNLASFGGSNQDPDLLRLRPGDPIEILVDASGLANFPPAISELNNASGLSEEAQVSLLKQRLGDENLARFIVSQNNGDIVNLQRTFRTQNVKFDWDAESGVKIAFDFQNYIEERYKATGSAGNAGAG